MRAMLEKAGSFLWTLSVFITGYYKCSFCKFLNSFWDFNLKSIISKLMSTNSRQMKFPPSQLLKIAVLVLCSPFLSPDPPLLCFICSPLLLPAAPISLTPPLLSLLPVPCTSAFPLLYPALLLCSHLSSRLPLFLSSSVRFVLWLQRLNLLAKHTKLRTCKCTQEKKNLRTFFTISWTLNGFWGCIQSVRIEARAVSAPLQQIYAWAPLKCHL